MNVGVGIFQYIVQMNYTTENVPPKALIIRFAVPLLVYANEFTLLRLLPMPTVPLMILCTRIQFDHVCGKLASMRCTDSLVWKLTLFRAPCLRTECEVQ